MALARTSHQGEIRRLGYIGREGVGDGNGAEDRVAVGDVGEGVDVGVEGVLVDLTKLLTVKALAKQLLLRGDRLDAVVWNAGIAGWSYLNYFKAVPDVLFGIIQATTYPKYMVCDVGALAKPQLGGTGCQLLHGKYAVDIKIRRREKLGIIFHDMDIRYSDVPPR